MTVPYFNLLAILKLDPEATEPTYIQISQQITEIIQSGRLQPGTPMPGTRTLAKFLGVSRNAAIAAYGELHREAWIETEVGSGTRVALKLPERRPQASQIKLKDPNLCGFDLIKDLEPARGESISRDWLDLRSASGDPRLSPEDEISRAFRRALIRQRPQWTWEAEPQGHPGLREALAELLMQRRALGIGPESILLTRHFNQSLALVARGLIQPGDRVAIEDPGNPALWECFHHAGAELVPIPVDHEGLKTELLEDACASKPIRLLCVTPSGHFPTTAVLSPERRAAVMGLASHHRFAILENDQMAELFYEDRNWAPLTTQDSTGQVILLGSFNHLFPGLGLGFLVGPSAFISRLARLRAQEGTDWESLLADLHRELILDGTYLRHVRKVRVAYRERRDVLAEALVRELDSDLAFCKPASGLYLWARVQGSTPLLPWIMKAREKGLRLKLGRDFQWEKKDSNGIFFGFGHLDEPHLLEAVQRLAQARPS